MAPASRAIWVALWFYVSDPPPPFCLRHIDSIEINCADVADERVPVLKDQLQKWFDEAAWHAPSILFFDDIDRLIPAEVEVSQRARDVLENG